MWKPALISGVRSTPPRRGELPRGMGPLARPISTISDPIVQDVSKTDARGVYMHPAVSKHRVPTKTPTPRDVCPKSSLGFRPLNRTESHPKFGPPTRKAKGNKRFASPAKNCLRLASGSLLGPLLPSLTQGQRWGPSAPRPARAPRNGREGCRHGHVLFRQIQLHIPP